MFIPNFNNRATYMGGAKKYDSYDIFMADSWFSSVPTEKYIRRDAGRFKGFFKTECALLTNYELESLNKRVCVIYISNTHFTYFGVMVDIYFILVCHELGGFLPTLKELLYIYTHVVQWFC